MLAHRCGNVTSAITAQFANPPRSMDRSDAPSTRGPTRKHWPTRRIGPRSMAACPSGSHGPRSMLVSTVLSLNCGQRASGSVTRSRSNSPAWSSCRSRCLRVSGWGRGGAVPCPAPSPRVASRVRVGRVQGFRHHRSDRPTRSVRRCGRSAGAAGGNPYARDRVRPAPQAIGDYSGHGSHRLLDFRHDQHPERCARAYSA